MYLGIDIGTSSVKTVLVDEAGQVVAQADAPLSVSRPAPLWSEQDPDDWWHACTRSVAAVRMQAGTGWKQVTAIGLSGQMHGAVLLGADERPLRPAILWNDGRSSAECAELERDWPDSLPPNCCGSLGMNRRFSPPAGECFCPRTMCACA
jgi:xylulokinase